MQLATYNLLITLPDRYTDKLSDTPPNQIASQDVELIHTTDLQIPRRIIGRVALDQMLNEFLQGVIFCIVTKRESSTDGNQMTFHVVFTTKSDSDGKIQAFSEVTTVELRKRVDKVYEIFKITTVVKTTPTNS